MKIKVSKELYVDLSTLIRLEWKGILPVLILAEKYENIIKWALRTIAFIGITSSIVSIDKWYFSLGVSIFIFIVEQFFETIIFEYTTIVVQSHPDFEIKPEHWKANAFMMPQTKSEANLPYMGPAYTDREYAVKFFNYLKNWSDNNSVDNDNKIVLSFVIEDDNKYTTYLYANPSRESVNRLFDVMGIMNRLDKYKKKQQKLLVQLMYWNTLPFKDGFSIKTFLERYKPGEQFYLMPFVIDNNDIVKEPLTELAILKSTYKINKRKDLDKFDIEYYHK